MRAQPRLGAWHWLRTVYSLNQWTSLKGWDRAGWLMHQKFEDTMRPCSAYIVPMAIAPKKVLVAATSPVLKHSGHLVKLPSHRSFHVIMRELYYYMGVISTSVQLFRKWGNDSNSEHYSWIIRLLLLVSEVQDEIGSESTKRIKLHAAFLSTHYTSAEWVRIHFCWCDLNSVETPKYLSTVPPHMVLS